MKRNVRFVSFVITLIFTLSFLCVGSAESSYTPGVYEGTGSGFGGAITIKITVDSEKLTDVVITAQDETPTVGGAAVEELAVQILKAQDAEIDGVSGASLTSEGVRLALAEALAKARGEEISGSTLVPGTYTTTAQGFRGEVTVEVEVDESTILSVTVVECTDSPSNVTDMPLAVIPERIVEQQSYVVDGISGATFTSSAIRNAVKDCLDQAGGSDGFIRTVSPTERTAAQDTETDVLVIGGGGAGIIAALAAYYKDFSEEPSGLSVTVVEKLPRLGGSTSVSGGAAIYYADPDGDRSEAWFNAAFETELAVLQLSNEDEVNEELLANMIRYNPSTMEDLAAMGLPFIPVGNNGFFFGEEIEPFNNCPSRYLSYFAEKQFAETDIDVRLETEATDLLVDENGAVIGANVVDSTSEYSIYAKKVILACGGFAQSPEMIERLTPQNVGAIPYCASSDTGDGMRMALDLGAQTVGKALLGYLGSDFRVGLWDDFNTPFHRSSGGSIHVDIHGNRYCDESMGANREFNYLTQLDDDTAYCIVDSDNANIDVLKSSQSEYVWSADTLEGLAELIGVPYESLSASIEKFNDSITTGIDTDFGTPVESMDAITEAPFYAFILRPVALSSLVGVKVNGDCEIFKADGSLIKNLYAAGDMIQGGNLVTYYVGGRGVATALYSGRIAGERAKASILEGSPAEAK